MLGAAMFMVEIAGMRCLYTGDYSRAPDRHMPPADLPELKPDIGEAKSTVPGPCGHCLCSSPVLGLQALL